jgi:hypothetical protein
LRSTFGKLFNYLGPNVREKVKVLVAGCVLAFVVGCSTTPISTGGSKVLSTEAADEPFSDKYLAPPDGQMNYEKPGFQILHR